MASLPKAEQPVDSAYAPSGEKRKRAWKMALKFVRSLISFKDADDRGDLAEDRALYANLEYCPHIFP